MNNNKLKVLSLFSGIGAFEKGLTDARVGYELVGFSEINKQAISSYCAIHGVDKIFNLGDVAKIENEDMPNADLVTYGFPCQDISVAGHQLGINKDTRSGLLYEAERIIKHIKPKYAIAENVKNLVGKKFKSDFDNLLKRLDSYGYNSYWKVLNAVDYGIPQARERVFVVSIRKDIDDGKFEFPEGFNKDASLIDVLEDDVDEKYYIDQKFRYSASGLALTPKEDKGRMGRQAIEIYNENSVSYGDTINPFNKSVNYSKHCPTITTRPEGFKTAILVVTKDGRLRKLTPLECLRLMGFKDSDYDKVSGFQSDAQIYKQSGNSIVVAILEKIFQSLFK